MDRSLHQLEQLTIVGTGLLGASVGLALKAAGYTGRVVGVGRRAATVEQARALGAVDAAATDFSVVTQSQLLVIAVPLGAFDAVLGQVAPHVHDRLVLTDVGSTKGSVRAAAHRHLSHPQRFVGAHPMAGSEQQGPDAACATLFAGKPCIITAESDTDAHALQVVESLWAALGMRLLRMSAHEHDQAVATVSHLPHAMATLLVQVAIEQGGWDVASTGFRDTTRLASSNPPMRADILSANRDAILEALGAMRGQIDRFIDLLQRDDHEAIRHLLEQSQQTRDDWRKGAFGDSGD